MQRVPMIILSIGVVTNERRNFSHSSPLSGQAGAMSGYTQSMPGAAFTVDRWVGLTAVEREARAKAGVSVHQGSR